MSSDDIVLKLGDVVKLEDPANASVDQQLFLVDFVNSDKIVLIQLDNRRKLLVEPNERGELTYEAGARQVQGLTVVSRNPKEGYALQHGLTVGKRIAIHVDLTGTKEIFNGRVVNLENDMIEVKMEGRANEPNIYIDFKYEGLPEDLFITSIDIYATSDSTLPKTKRNRKRKHWTDGETEWTEEGEGEEEGEREGEEREENVGAVAASSTGRSRLLQMTYVGELTTVERSELPESQHRYNLQEQTNDLLEHLLSALPVSGRTPLALDRIHTIIARYVQLRQLTSLFRNQHVVGYLRRTSEDRPLADRLATFRAANPWLLLVAQNKHAVFDTDGEVADDVALKESNWLSQVRNAANSLGAVFNTSPPLFPVTLTHDNSVFGSAFNVIVQGNVGENMNVVSNNLQDFYSTVMTDQGLAQQRFVFDRYIVGEQQIVASQFRGRHFEVSHKQVSPDDPVCVSSLLVLPMPVVIFSRQYGPTASILTRAQLSRKGWNAWEYLNNVTNVTSNVITNVSGSDGRDNGPFVLPGAPKQYSLDLTLSSSASTASATASASSSLLSNEARYKAFLQKVVPKIKDLFKQIQPFCSFEHGLSFVEAVQWMEPFMVSIEHITFRQYMVITDFVTEQINAFNGRLQTHKQLFRGLNKDLVNAQRTVVANAKVSFNEDSLLGSLPPEVLAAYQYDSRGELDNMLFCPLEMLGHVLATDGGQLMNLQFAMANPLLLPPNVEKKIATAAEKLQRTDHAKNDRCATIRIVKKYYSLESLKQDNGHNMVFVDPALDRTNYAQLDSVARGLQWQNTSSSLSKEEKIQLLASKLRATQSLSQAEATHLATSWAEERQRVRSGEYALLILSRDIAGGVEADKSVYYVRRGNRWEEDDETTEKQMPYESNTGVLCDVQSNCVYSSAGDQCESLTESKAKLKQGELRRLMAQFDESYSVEQEQWEKTLAEEKTRLLIRLGREQALKTTQALKNNQIQYTLGLLADTGAESAPKDSPYRLLCDLILRRENFAQKQNMIVQFVDRFCEEGEDKWWLYCKKTQVKLMPKFYHFLAVAFVAEGSQKYVAVLDLLKKEVGMRSDDGGFWVDKHSGEVMCVVDDSTANLYEQGRVFDEDGEENEGDEENEYRDETMTRTVEKDTGKESLVPQPAQLLQRVPLDGDVGTIQRVVFAMCQNMSIGEADADSLSVLVCRIVIHMLNDPDVLATQAMYSLNPKTVQTPNGPKAVAYAVLKNSTLLYLTLGMLLVAIQVSPPSVKLGGNPLPKCSVSFSGFPLDPVEEDKSGIQYLACVAAKTKTDGPPWKQIHGTQEGIVHQMTSAIRQWLLNNEEVAALLANKRLQLIADALIPENALSRQYDVMRWSTFLPPLKPFQISSSRLEPVDSDVLRTLRSGAFSRVQATQDMLEGKVAALSLGIQMKIQAVVSSQDRLFFDFVSNACCYNEDTSQRETTLQYFANKQNMMKIYNERVKEYSNCLSDMALLCKAPMFLSIENSKRSTTRKSQEQPPSLSEDTVFLAFIHFCKFHKLSPIPDDLLPYCPQKPRHLSRLASLADQIALLKREPQQFTATKCLALLQAVGRQHMMSIVTAGSQTCQERCGEWPRRLLLASSSEQRGATSVEFLTLLKKITTRNEFLTFKPLHEQQNNEHMNNMKNFLMSQTKELAKKVKMFVQGATTHVSGPAKLAFAAHLDYLTKWHWYDEKNVPVELIDSSNLQVNRTVYVNYKNKGLLLKATILKNNQDGTVNVNFHHNPRTADNGLSDDGLCNSVAFLKEHIKLLAVTLPSLISSRVPNDGVPILDLTEDDVVRPYWKLANKHATDVYERLRRDLTLVQLNVFGGDAMSDAYYAIWHNVLVKCRPLYELSESTPSFSPKVNLAKKTEDVNSFDRDTTLRLLEYYLLSVLVTYVEETAQYLSNKQPRFVSSYAYDFDEDEDDTSSMPQQKAKTVMADWLVRCVNVVAKHKAAIDQSFQQVFDKMYTIREQEKQRLRNLLKNKTEEDRQLDRMADQVMTARYDFRYSEEVYANDQLVRESIEGANPADAAPEAEAGAGAEDMFGDVYSRLQTGLNEYDNDEGEGDFYD